MNSDTKRFLMAIVLSGFVLLGWQYIFPHKAPVVAEQQTTTQTSDSAPVEKVASEKIMKEKNAPADLSSSVEIKTVILKSGERSIVIDNNLNIHDFVNPGQMHTFVETLGNSNPIYFLVENNGSYKPLNFELKQISDSEFTGTSPIGATVRGKFLPNGRFNIDINSDSALKFKVEYRSQKKHLDSNLNREFVYYTNEADRFSVGSDEKGDGVFKWMAIDFNYHLFATVFKDKQALRYTATEGGVVAADFAQPVKEFSFDYVFLKKNYDDLIALGDKLEMSVDFGFFGVIAVPMLRAMQWLYRFIPNYGIAIIILTLLMRLVLYPLQHKSAKSMKKMQQLQPQLQKIKEKYKDDQQRVQKETMELFKREKANPMGGCLPLLLQMPVFFAIYRVLYSAVELVDAPFFGWITDLSAKDPYYVFPVLLTITMFLQQKMMPTASTDPNQKKIMMAMPLVFGFIMKDMPSGLVLYIFVSTLFAIIQQYLTNKLTD